LGAADAIVVDLHCKPASEKQALDFSAMAAPVS
jgi:calcineurin-like phosphoesterase